MHLGTPGKLRREGRVVLADANGEGRLRQVTPDEVELHPSLCAVGERLDDECDDDRSDRRRCPNPSLLR